MRILVTGAAGFIGSHVAKHLKLSGHDVIGVDDFSGGTTDNVPDGVPCISLDLTNRELVGNLFSFHGAFDAVFHLAAYAAEGLSHNIATFNYTNNLLSTVHLTNECIRQVERGYQMPHFVFTSSIAVYGHAETLPVDEQSPTNPADPYGVAKLACEGHIKAVHEFFGMNYSIFRPYNVYGEGQNLNDPYRNVVGIFLRKVLSDEPMTIFGDGTQSRAFSYIDDVAPIIARSITTPAAKNETFCIGGEVHCTVDQLAGHIAKALSKEKNVTWLDARNEVKAIFASPKKLRKAFGIKESPVSLEVGIEKMAQWAKTQSLKDPKPFGNIEVTMNLPPSWAQLKEAPAPQPIYGVVRRPSNAELAVATAMPTIDKGYVSGKRATPATIGGNHRSVSESVNSPDGGHVQVRL